MQKFVGYIRVSTAKQGEGVSLQEQRYAIERFAGRNSLTIVAWFEERETAAKRGRPVFNQMLKLLRQGKADGVVIHKIDRSARNLKDWADLGELIDRGIDVRFANEGLDLQTRGGRLSADIQAVVAADYIRNLREETRKGFYGRIKQGLYPLPAPIGYTDQGKGRPKELDEIRAPLVKKVFELYASGRYSLDTLTEEVDRLGLRNRRGRKLSMNGMSVMLNNPFYIGLIRLKRTNEIFQGAHAPLISASLFRRVQDVLNGKTNARVQRHDFLFRRVLACKHCRYSLIGERQKGHVYYRCHTKQCPPTCIREDAAEREVLRVIAPLEFGAREKKYVAQKIDKLKQQWSSQEESVTSALKLRLSSVQERLDRLTDGYLDHILDKETFEERKARLLTERREIEDQIARMQRPGQSVPEQLARFLELAGSVSLQYKCADAEEKRELLKTITSNRHAEGKEVAFTLSFPFREVANRFENSYGAPYRGRPRTLDRLLRKLIKYFKENPAPVLGGEEETEEYMVAA
jgi:DNA invertase Pin-like site-specific DNA recombinase